MLKFTDKVESFKNYLTSIAIKQRGDGHYTPNVANSYTTAVNVVGDRIQHNLWQIENGAEIRSLLNKIEGQEWFIVGDPHKTWYNGILRYSEFLDYQLKEDQTKIGKFVREKTKYLFEHNLVPRSEIQNLFDKQYCSKVFKLSFPFLRNNDGEKILRYWSPSKSPDPRFQMCSEWYEKSREPFIKWYELMLKNKR